MGLIFLSENMLKNCQLHKFDTWLHECWVYPFLGSVSPNYPLLLRVSLLNKFSHNL